MKLKKLFKKQFKQLKKQHPEDYLDLLQNDQSYVTTEYRPTLTQEEMLDLVDDLFITYCLHKVKQQQKQLSKEQLPPKIQHILSELAQQGILATSCTRHPL